MDSVRKETHVVSAMIGGAQTREGQSSSPAPNSKAKTDGEIPSKSSANRGEGPSVKRGRIPCRETLRMVCTEYIHFIAVIHIQNSVVF